MRSTSTAPCHSEKEGKLPYAASARRVSIAGSPLERITRVSLPRSRRAWHPLCAAAVAAAALSKRLAPPVLWRTGALACPTTAHPGWTLGGTGEGACPPLLLLQCRQRLFRGVQQGVRPDWRAGGVLHPEVGCDRAGFGHALEFA